MVVHVIISVSTHPGELKSARVGVYGMEESLEQGSV